MRRRLRQSPVAGVILLVLALLSAATLVLAFLPSEDQSQLAAGTLPNGQSFIITGSEALDLDDPVVEAHMIVHTDDGPQRAGSVSFEPKQDDSPMAGVESPSNGALVVETPTWLVRYQPSEEALGSAGGYAALMDLFVVQIEGGYPVLRLELPLALAVGQGGMHDVIVSYGNLRVSPGCDQQRNGVCATSGLLQLAMTGDEHGDLDLVITEAPHDH